MWYFLISRDRCLRILSKSNEIRTSFNHEANIEFLKNETIWVISYFVSQACFSFINVSRYFCLRSVWSRSLWVMILNESAMYFTQNSTHSQSLACVCSWFKYILIETMWVSVFKIETKRIRKTLVITRKHLFY